MSPFDPEQRLMASLKKRQEELQFGVFSSPPQCWEEFQRLLGTWQENTRQQEELVALVNAIHEEEK